MKPKITRQIQKKNISPIFLPLQLLKPGKTKEYTLKSRYLKGIHDEIVVGYVKLYNKSKGKSKG